MLTALFYSAGGQPRPEALARLVETSTAFGPDYAFNGVVTQGGIEQREITQDWLSSRVLEPNARYGFSLASRALLLRYHCDIGLGGRYLLTLDSRNDLAEDPLADLPFASDFLEATSQAYEATVTTLYSADLLTLARVGALVGSDDDPASSELLPQIARDLPKTLWPRLTSWVHPLRYDVASVPEGVGWINVWSSQAIATIGLQRVEAQPWYIQRTTSGDGRILVTTANVPTLDDLTALTRLAEITEGLGLDELKSS